MITDETYLLLPNSFFADFGPTKATSLLRCSLGSCSRSSASVCPFLAACGPARPAPAPRAAHETEASGPRGPQAVWSTCCSRGLFFSFSSFFFYVIPAPKNGPVMHPMAPCAALQGVLCAARVSAAPSLFLSFLSGDVAVSQTRGCHPSCLPQWPVTVLLGLVFSRGLMRLMALTQNPGGIVTADCWRHREGMGEGWTRAAAVGAHPK